MSNIPKYVLDELMVKHTTYLNNLLDHIKKQFNNVIASEVLRVSNASFESMITITPDNIPNSPIYIINKGLYSLIQTNNKTFSIKFSKIAGQKKPHYYDLNNVIGDLPHHISIPLRERDSISLNDVLQIVYNNNVPMVITAIIYSILSEMLPNKDIKLQRTTADSDILRFDKFKIDIAKQWTPGFKRRIFDIRINNAIIKDHKNFSVDIDRLNDPNSIEDIRCTLAKILEHFKNANN